MHTWLIKTGPDLKRHHLTGIDLRCFDSLITDAWILNFDYLKRA